VLLLYGWGISTYISLENTTFMTKNPLISGEYVSERGQFFFVERSQKNIYGGKKKKKLINVYGGKML